MSLHSHFSSGWQNPDQDIFKSFIEYLDWEQILNSETVNSRWQVYIRNPRFWKSITVKEIHSYPCCAIWFYQIISKLTISSSYWISAESDPKMVAQLMRKGSRVGYVEIFKCCTHLQYLKCELRNVFDFVALFAAPPTLKCLELDMNPLLPFGIRSSIPRPQNNQCLKQLHFNKGIQYFASDLYLSIVGYFLTYFNLYENIDQLCLCALNLSTVHLARFIDEHLFIKTSLRYLDISFNLALDDDICATLCKLENLETLRTHNVFNLQLLKQRHPNPNLKIIALTLCENGLDPDDISTVMQQAQVARPIAIKALKLHKNIVDAIVSLIK